MITRDSRFFFGAAAISECCSALLYGFLTGASDHGGVVPVFRDGAWSTRWSDRSPSAGRDGSASTSATRCCWLSPPSWPCSAASPSAFRDADAESLAQIEGIDAADLPPGSSSCRAQLVAAAGGGLGTGVVIVGLAFSSCSLSGRCGDAGGRGVRVDGHGLVRAGHRATPRLNAEYRSRLLQPAEAADRVRSWSSPWWRWRSHGCCWRSRQSAAVYVIIGLAALIFGVANLLSRRPELAALGAVGAVVS